MADVSKIKLPNGTTYNIKDDNALPLTGGSVAGPVSFGDSVSIDEATVGDLVVNGSASFTNNLQANTINGVTVGNSPKFTDTTYSNLTAASGGTAVSLVTTGEKYTWNSKSGATNWVNGSQTGSVRTNSSAAESSSYTIGQYAVAEGSGTQASGLYAHAEGGGTTASGAGAHAEGAGTMASGVTAHAEGGGTKAQGNQSHAEGGSTTASGVTAHAEGGSTIASGDYSHVEGSLSKASGQGAHAENYDTTASGDWSHAEGRGTIANHLVQHVFGQYNISDPSAAATSSTGNYIEIVGNGTSGGDRHNARTLDWSGNEVLAGKLTVGIAGTNSMDVAIVGQLPTKTSQLTNDSNFLTSLSSLNAANLNGQISSTVISTSGIATTSYVTTAIANLPEPMIFKGSVGTGGTVTSLPTAAASNEGHTYKVITALSSPSAKVGDTVISNGSSWVVIPSGDEPSGTVTSVAVSNGGGLSVSGSPITSSGTITISHADTSSQASSSNSGRTYIQSLTLDTYGHVTGISTATETVTDTNTWRTIQVNGTDILGSGTGTGKLNLKAGSNVSITNSSGTVTIAATDTTYESKAAASGGTAVSLVTTGEKYTWNSKTSNTGTITSVKTTAGTHTAINVSSGAVNFNVPTKTSHLTNDSGYLTNSTLYEGRLNWGNINLAGNVTPIGMSLSAEHSANRIAYLNSAAIQIEYTTNGGSTWTDSGYTNDEKMWLCTGSAGIAVGQSKSGYSQSTALTTNHWTRITLTGQNGSNGYVYTSPRKLLINVGTAVGLNCLIEYKTGVSGASWQTFGTYTVSGWSGWNDIPLILSTFGGGTTQTSNIWYLRFTFKVTSTRTDSYKGYAQVLSLRLFGATDWGSASSGNSKGPFSSTGHLYSYDVGANATFPAKVTANGGFSGNLTGNVTGNVSGSAGSVAWSGVTGKPTSTGSKVTGITASTTATKTTLGTAFTIPNVTSAGSASTWAFEEVSIPNVTAAGSASTWAFEDIACDDITSWSAGSGSASISGAVDSSDSTQLNITISHTHTAPSLSYTARTVSSKKSGANGSAPTLGTAIKVQSKKSGANGSAPTLGTAFTVPNVTGNTSATVSITDPGHTHSI